MNEKSKKQTLKVQVFQVCISNRISLIFFIGRAFIRDGLETNIFDSSRFGQYFVCSGQGWAGSFSKNKQIFILFGKKISSGQV